MGTAPTCSFATGLDRSGLDSVAPEPATRWTGSLAGRTAVIPSTFREHNLDEEMGVDGDKSSNLVGQSRRRTVRTRLRWSRLRQSS